MWSWATYTPHPESHSRCCTHAIRFTCVDFLRTALLKSKSSFCAEMRRLSLARLRSSRGSRRSFGGRVNEFKSVDVLSVCYGLLVRKTNGLVRSGVFIVLKLHATVSLSRLEFFHSQVSHSRCHIRINLDCNRSILTLRARLQTNAICKSEEKTRKFLGPSRRTLGDIVVGFPLSVRSWTTLQSFTVDAFTSFAVYFEWHSSCFLFVRSFRDDASLVHNRYTRSFISYITALSNPRMTYTQTAFIQESE